MCVRMKVLALTLGMLLSVACSSLTEQDETEALAQEFLAWIAGETGLPIAPLPSIVFVSEDQIRARVDASAQVEGNDSARALYVYDTATIYLPANWSRRKIYHRAMLLHELVHHVQLINRLPARCSAERERQAYGLTLKWLSSQGVEDPYAVLNIDDFTVAILSLCVGPES